MKRDSEFRIGDVQVSPKRNLLIVEKAELSLEPRVMDVLCYLARNATEVVSRDELIENIWEVEYGGDESLTRAISILRKTFKSAGIEEVVIETIPKRGYRMVVNSEIVKNVENFATSPAKHSPNPTKPNRMALWGGTSLLVLAGAFFLMQGGETSPQADVTKELRQLSKTAIDVCNGNENILSVDLEKGIECKALTSVLSEADKQKYKDMARMRDPSLYIEGLDRLEAHAQSFEAWRLIAELSAYKDPNRSIRAAEKALKIQPDHFHLRNLRAQMLGVVGREIEAREASKELKKVAATDHEKFMAAYTFLNVAVLLDGKELIKEAHGNFETHLSQISKNLTSKMVDEKVDERDIEAHPYWQLAAGYQSLANAELRLDFIEDALRSLEESNFYFKALVPISGEEVAFAPIYRMTVNNEKKVEVLKEEKRYDDALKTAQENLRLFFDLRDTGYKSTGIRFPDTWFEIGELYRLKDDPANAKLMFENAEAEYQSLLNDNPNHSKALKGLEDSRAKLATIAESSNTVSPE